MSVSQITAIKPNGTDISLNSLYTWAGVNAYGRDRVSLTEWNTAVIPQVAIGSIFEAAGAYYSVDSNTSIGGSPTDGTCYILFNDSTNTFQFTNTLPVWDSEKFGYYDTVTGYKALNFSMIKSGSNYNYKKIEDFESRIFGTQSHSFEVYRSTPVTMPDTSGVDTELTTTLDTLTYNYNNNYSTTTGRYTAPENGFYNFYFGAQISGTQGYWGIVKNGADYLALYEYLVGSNNSVPNMTTAYLNKNEYVSLFYSVNGSTFAIARIVKTGLNDYNPRFGGYKIG